MGRYPALFFIFVVFCTTKTSSRVSSNAKLRPGGLHVVGHTRYYNTYSYYTASHTSYESYRSCCKRFIWCVSHCMKYTRTTSYHTQSALSKRSFTQYLCAPGWAVQHSEEDQCLQAICTPDCDKGECVQPDQCLCQHGYEGARCERDIDECTKHPCEHTCKNLPGTYRCSCIKGYRKVSKVQTDGKCEDWDECALAKKNNKTLCQCVNNGKCTATCVNTNGSFSCECHTGFHKVSPTLCADTDECKTGEHDCEQICVNTEPKYKCACEAGFTLKKNKRSCADIDECNSGMSNGGCFQLCANTIGSFKCSCRKGYELAKDMRNCDDIDECQIGRPCDIYHGRCKNELGGYYCGCKPGYELQYDKKTCKDINECERVNECNQNCLNTDGGYYCTCNPGYRLTKDRKTCEDIDECKEGTSRCSHNCTNIDGTYLCVCPTGYYLGKDGHTCIGDPCKKLYKPHRGFIKCTGVFINDHCKFGCDPGYANIGLNFTRCMKSSRWFPKGRPKCDPATCEDARPPENGVLVLPCASEYNTTCIIRCKKGYHMNGTSDIKCKLDDKKRTKWFVNAVCNEINVCKPNPCQHKGKCSVVSDKEFKCDCTNTGYRGHLCDRGFMTVPDFPHMLAGEESEEFTIKAKPERSLVIKLTCVPDNSAIFHPNDTLEMFAPSETIEFTVTPNNTGLIVIRYTLFGKEAFQFDQPADGIIYAFPSNDTKRLSNIPGEKFMRGGCYSTRVGRCKDGSNITFTSSCTWHPSGTSGYVSVNTGNVTLPFSMMGVSYAASEGIGQFSNNDVLTVQRLTQAMLRSGTRTCPHMCPDMSYTNADNKFFLKRNSFLRTYYNNVGDLTPWWITCNLPPDYDGFHINDMQSLLVRARKMKELAKVNCPNIPANLEGTHSALVTRSPVNIDILGQSTVFDSITSTCIVHDLCNKASYFSLPSDKHMDLASSVSSLDVHLHGFGFGNNNFQKKICVPVWNGMTMEDKNFCVEPKMWSKSNIRFDMADTNLQFQGEMFIEPKDIDNVMLERFNLVQKTYMKGALTGEIPIHVWGSKVTLISTDQQATIATRFGGSEEHCIPGTQKGIHLSMHSPNVSVLHETSALRIYPAKGKIQSHLYFDLLKGHVLSVHDVFAVTEAIKYAMLPISKTKRLLRSFKRKMSKYKLELERLRSICSKFESRKKEAVATTKAKSPNYKDVLVSINKMKRESTYLQDALIAFRDAVRINETSKSSLRKYAEKYIMVIIKRLEPVNSLVVKPELAKLLEIKDGLSVSYFGNVCVHNLCFSNNVISIFDLTRDPVCTTYVSHKKLSEYVYITAISKKAKKLGPYFLVPPNSKIEITMSKKAASFEITFPATVALFNRNFDVTVKVNQTQFEFKIPKTSIEHVSDFDIVASSEFRLSSTWDSIDFQYTGTGSSSSSPATKLEKMVDDIIVSVGSKTGARISTLYKNQKHFSDLVKLYQGRVSYLEKQYKMHNETSRKARAAYYTAKTNFTVEKKRFQSQVDTSTLQNLKKLLDAKCVIKECKEVCASVQLHVMCQKLTTGYQNEIRCDHSQVTTHTTVEEGKAGQCQLTKISYHRVYTGTCQKGGNSVLKSSMRAGAAVGAIVAGPLAPVGAAIGAAIGAFASLFSSCDETYAAVRNAKPYNVPCVRRGWDTKTHKYTVTKCYTVHTPITKPDGEPYPCPDPEKRCIKTNDPECMADNNNCLKKRVLVRTQTLQGLHITNPMWQQMDKYELALKVLLPLMVQANNARLESKRKFERAANYLKRAKLHAKYTNYTIANIKKYLHLEQCFLRAYNEHKDHKGFLKVKQIFFETQVPDAENILLQLYINHKDRPQVLQQFVYFFRDALASVRHGVKRILTDNLCRDMLFKQRSFVGTNDTEGLSILYPFSGISKHKEAKASDVACANTEKVFAFLQGLHEKLSNTSKNALTQESEIKKSQSIIEGRIQELKGKNEDPVVKEQLKTMEDARERHEDELKELSISNVWSNLYQNLELFTKAFELKNCFHTRDCVHASLENLQEMPGMLKVPRDAYSSQIQKVEEIFNKIFDEPDTLLDLEQLASELQTSTNSLKEMTGFCEKAPEVKLLSPSKVVAFHGDIVELKCNSKSTLPVFYRWKHHNRTLPLERGSKLRLFIQNSTRGRYICESWNRIGNSSSNETYIIVRQKPELSNQPEDFRLLNPLTARIKPFFVCNVTGDPAPKISWYHHPFHQPNQSMKLHQTGPVLIINKPSVANNGFYYCIAINQYGTVKSKKARLDVSPGHLPQQQLSLDFQVPLSRKLAKTKKYAERMKNDSDVEAQQSVGVNMEDAGADEVKLKVAIDDRVDDGSNAYAMGELDFLRKVSMSRKSVSEGLQRIVSGIVDTHGKHFEWEMERTMSLGFDGDQCKNGHSLHENGFSCVPCHAGFYEFSRRCLKCPIGTYQPQSGQTKCIPCASTEVTDMVGSLTHHECQSPVLHAMDIMFVLDISRSLSANEFQKVRSSVSKFVQDFIGKGKDVKFGLITYSDRVDYSVRLVDHGHSISSVVHQIDGILQSKSDLRRTERAVHEAANALSQGSEDSRSKVVISLISGTTSGGDGITGFQLLRNESLLLRRFGIHSVAMGIGSHIDHSELLALASKKKESNIIQFENGNELLKNLPKVPAVTLKGKCGFSTKDVAIAVESSSTIDDDTWENAIHFFNNFMAAFVKDSLIKFGLVSYGKKIVTSPFKSFHNVQEIATALSQLPRVRDRLDTPNTLSFLYNSYITEKYESFKDKKIIIFVSKEPVDDEVLAHVNRDFLYEDVKFLNVVMTLEKQVSGVADIGIEEGMKAVYSLAEATELVNRVKFLKSNVENRCHY